MRVSGNGGGFFDSIRVATLIFPGTRREDKFSRVSIQGNIHFRQKSHSHCLRARCFPHFKSAKESNATHDGSELMLATGSSYWAGIARDTLCLANEAADVAADL